MQNEDQSGKGLISQTRTRRNGKSQFKYCNVIKTSQERKQQQQQETDLERDNGEFLRLQKKETHHALVCV